MTKGDRYAVTNLETLRENIRTYAEYSDKHFFSAEWEKHVKESEKALTRLIHFIRGEEDTK